MFLNTLIKVLQPHQQWFAGKPTIARFMQYPLTTIEERFEFLLELSTFANSLRIAKIPDGKESIPNTRKIQSSLTICNSMNHNTIVVGFNITQIMQELSFEIREATNDKGDFDKIVKIYTGEIPSSEFLNVPLKTTFLNKIYSFNGKSGKNYSGTGIAGLTAYNTVDLADILEGLQLDPEVSLIRDYILANEEEMKNEWKNFRMAMLPFLKWHFDPASTDSKIVEYVKQKLLEPKKEEEIRKEEPMFEKTLTKKELKALRKQKA